MVNLSGPQGRGQEGIRQEARDPIKNLLRCRRTSLLSLWRGADGDKTGGKPVDAVLRTELERWHWCGVVIRGTKVGKQDGFQGE